MLDWWGISPLWRHRDYYHDVDDPMMHLVILTPDMHFICSTMLIMPRQLLTISGR